MTKPGRDDPRKNTTDPLLRWHRKDTADLNERLLKDVDVEIGVRLDSIGMPPHVDWTQAFLDKLKARRPGWETAISRRDSNAGQLRLDAEPRKPTFNRGAALAEVRRLMPHVDHSDMDDQELGYYVEALRDRLREDNTTGEAPAQVDTTPDAAAYLRYQAKQADAWKQPAAWNPTPTARSKRR